MLKKKKVNGEVIKENDGEMAAEGVTLSYFHRNFFEARKLKDTFDRKPAADGYVRPNLLIAAGPMRVNIKLMGGSL